MRSLLKSGRVNMATWFLEHGGTWSVLAQSGKGVAEPGHYWSCVNGMLSHYRFVLVSVWWGSLIIGSICKTMAEPVNYWLSLGLLDVILKSMTTLVFIKVIKLWTHRRKGYVLCPHVAVAIVKASILSSVYTHTLISLLVDFEHFSHVVTT
jgi:uncharacterized membrane protein